MRPCFPGAIQSPAVPQRSQPLFPRVAPTPLLTGYAHLRNRDSVAPVLQQRFSIFRKLLALPLRHAAPFSQNRYSSTWPINLLETRRLARRAGFQPPAIPPDTCVLIETPHTAIR